MIEREPKPGRCREESVKVKAGLKCLRCRPVWFSTRGEWVIVENTVVMHVLSPEHRSELNTEHRVPLSVIVCISV